MEEVDPYKDVFSKLYNNLLSYASEVNAKMNKDELAIDFDNFLNVMYEINYESEEFEFNLKDNYCFFKLLNLIKN